MKASIQQLIGGTLLVWAIFFWPARWLGGSEVLAQSLAGCLLCLVPSVLALAWAQYAVHGKPEDQLAAMIGGMLLRMVVVLSGGIALFFTVPILHSAAFWMWTLGFYLFTLILEITLVSAAFRREREPSRALKDSSVQPSNNQPAADTLSL